VEGGTLINHLRDRFQQLGQQQEHQICSSSSSSIITKENLSHADAADESVDSVHIIVTYIL
jgi:hypothetical protein